MVGAKMGQWPGGLICLICPNPGFCGQQPTGHRVSAPPNMLDSLLAIYRAIYMQPTWVVDGCLCVTCPHATRCSHLSRWVGQHNGPLTRLGAPKFLGLAHGPETGGFNSGKWVPPVTFGAPQPPNVAKHLQKSSVTPGYASVQYGTIIVGGGGEYR